MTTSLYERVGGTAFFVKLADAFYVGVKDDPILRPMYPSDLAAASNRLALFIAQYFGGPDDYNKLRGEPMLRMRHMGFKVDIAARNAWVTHMEQAVYVCTDDKSIQAELLKYFSDTATFLLNQGLSFVGS